MKTEKLVIPKGLKSGSWKGRWQDKYIGQRLALGMRATEWLALCCWNRKLRRAFHRILALARLVALASPHLLKRAAPAKSCFKNKPKGKRTKLLCPHPNKAFFLPHGHLAGIHVRVASQKCLPCTAPKHCRYVGLSCRPLRLILIINNNL